MKDRFKFRLWYEPENKMMLFNNPTLLDGKVCSNDNGGLLFRNYDHNIKNVHECKPEDFSIMQCTGLKDKNGTLIYEGDIVKDNFTNSIYEVVYKKCAICLENEEYIGYLHELRSCYTSDRLEIIGNAFENPKLLKA